MNIVITGAGGVLCSAFSRALAADGHKIALLDLNLEAAEREAEGIRKAGGEAIAVQADVSDAAQVEALFAAATEAFGRVDILVNNAGITRDNLIVRISEEDFDERVFQQRRYAGRKRAVVF